MDLTVVYLTVFYFYVKNNFLDVSVGAAVYNFCD